MGAGRAERRQLSVVFCDLVGSTELSRRLDPEDLREVVQQYQEVCVRCISQFRGYVAQYLGDGILAYFGYPIAFEDTAERAVRAGLAIVDGIIQLDRKLRKERQVEIAVRVGIDTGVVVVGEVGSGSRREHLALGDAPNRAARIQSVAAPNALVTSEATQRLISNVFETVDLGPYQLKGISDGAHLFEVIRERLDLGPLDIVGARDPAVAIGRDRELEQMQQIWTGVEEGKGAFVSISGEAGIGKSHLVRAFRQHLVGSSYSAFQVRCSLHHASSPYYPLVDLLHRMLNFYPDQPLDERRAMLEFVLERNQIDVPDAFVLLAELLGLDFSGDAAPARHYRDRLRDALIALIISPARDRPLLFVVEDIHWIDPSTLELLRALSLRTPGLPLMLVVTSRPHGQIDWPREAPVVRIPLDRLPRRHVLDMVASIVDTHALPAAVVDQILERTDGVPLFVRELTKMVVESGRYDEGSAGPAFVLDDGLAIPSTLHDSLMARLDQLLPVKEVAQLCAVIGREFSYEVVRATTHLPEKALREALDRLVDAELLITDGPPPRNTYVFRHALIQEAAYESLLRSTRQQHHRRVAAHYASEAPGRADPVAIAHHYARGGRPDEAARFWYLAGQRAQARSANVEAEQHFRNGFEALEQQPVAPDRRHLQLLLQAGLGAAALQVKGYAHPDVRTAFERAAALAQDVEDDSVVLPVLRGLLAHNLVMGRHDVAATVAQNVASIGGRTSQHRIEGLRAVATAAIWRGDARTARPLLEQALEELGDAPGEATGLLFEEHGVGIHSYLAVVHWYAGDAATAIHHSSTAVERARALGHPYSLAYSLGFGTLLHSCLWRTSETRRLSEGALTIGETHGFAFWTTATRILHAWTYADEDAAAAIARMRDGIAGLERQGVALWLSQPRCLLAELLTREGRGDEALALATDALHQALKCGELHYAPEIYRVKAGALIAGDPQAAYALLEDGLRMAVGQEARPLILRILLDMLRAPVEEERRADVLDRLRTWVADETELPEAVEAAQLLGNTA